MRRSWVAASVLLAVVLTGCSATVAGQAGTAAGQSPDVPAPASGSVVSASTGGTSSDPGPAPTPASSDGSGGTTAPAGSTVPAVLFGQPLTLTGSVVVTVTAGRPYTPSATAATGRSTHFLRFGFTVRNQGTGALDLKDFRAQVLSSGSIGDLVFDSANGVGDVPEQSVAPAGSATFSLVFGANDPSDVAMQVQVGYDGPPGLVLSKAPSTAAKSTEPATTGPVVFGRPRRFADGLAVTAAPPAAYTPTSTAAYTTAKAYVSIAVTVRNDSGAAFALTDMDTGLTSAGRDADSIADLANGIQAGTPSAVLPNGASLTFTMAFSVSDPHTLQLSVAPTLDDEPGLWTSG